MMNIVSYLFQSVCSLCELIMSSLRSKGPPGPLGLPLLGYLPFLQMEKPHVRLNELAKKYGNVFSLYLGRTYCVFLNDFESVKEAFSQSASLDRPPYIFDSLPNKLGFGSANGAEWVEHRRFSTKSMKEIGLGRTKWEELLQEEVKSLVKRVHDQEGRPLEMSSLLSLTFSQNIISLLLGHRLPLDHPSTHFISYSVDRIVWSFGSLTLNNYLPRLNRFLGRTGLNDALETNRRLKEFASFMEGFVEERLQEHAEDDQESFVKLYAQEMNKQCSKGNSTFTDRMLQGNTHVLVLGGSETTRTSMTWLLLAMARHQDKQDRVHQELDRVLGKEGQVGWSDRTLLTPYTTATILEGLRWSSIIAINSPRMTNQEMSIQGHHIPKGTFLIANYWALHHDPRYWEEPEQFQPERFLNEDNSINFRPDSFAPFSYGKRSCPGEMIAMMEIQKYFTTLLQNFRVLPGGDISNVRCIMGLTYQALGVKLRFLPHHSTEEELH